MYVYISVVRNFTVFQNERRNW